MKQYHSYNRLFFHLIFWTKRREGLIRTRGDESLLFDAFKKKAHDLDAYIEELGSWYDHVHMLVRCPPTLLLSKLYGQLKGFSSYRWSKEWPERPFAWGDGVYIASVDPWDNHGLRGYIRNQRRVHSLRTQFDAWEVHDFGAFSLDPVHP